MCSRSNCTVREGTKASSLRGGGGGGGGIQAKTVRWLKEKM